ncbi:MAG: MFS transporter [Elusimicrobiaceae bacterium]|nr:MFS transporter [Elusimicrobiaceae bacterium]
MSTRKLFWILFSLNLLNYIDRQVLYSVFPLLQTDLSLTDLQLGSLASVFMVVYMCYAPIVGYFADRTPRPRWIAASALVWGGATLFCAAAKNYLSLLLARGFIGVGEGGFTTIAQPFLAEKYPQEKRATALALFGLALPAGSAIGYLLGGLIGQHWGWKAAFMVAGVPGVFLGLWAGLEIKDEHRELQKKEDRPQLADYLSLLKNKPFLFICLAHAMITFIIGGLSAWMPTYLHRYLEMNIAQAGTIFGGLVVVCGALGTYSGGKLADLLLNKTGKAYFWVMAISLIGLLLPAWIGIQTNNPLTALMCFGLAITCLFLPTGPISAAIIAATRSNVHSMAFAVNIFIIHALGDAFSPVLLGRISDGWNLKIAVLCCCFAAIPGLLFTYLAACLERRDYRENLP